MTGSLFFWLIASLAFVIVAAFVLLAVRGWRWSPERTSPGRAITDIILIVAAHPILACGLVLTVSQWGYAGDCFVLDPTQSLCTRAEYARLQLHQLVYMLPLFKLTSLCLMALGLLLMARLRRRRKLAPQKLAG